jgi:hypothetical protein
VKLVRVILYEGSKEWLKSTIAQSIEGKYEILPGKTITSFILDETKQKAKEEFAVIIEEFLR